MATTFQIVQVGNSNADLSQVKTGFRVILRDANESETVMIEAAVQGASAFQLSRFSFDHFSS